MDLNLFIALLGVPSALYGIFEIFRRSWAFGRDYWEGRGGRPDYIILNTYVKYIMWEDFSELIKLRQIRALRRVRELRLDRYPRAGARGSESECAVENFYSIPGSTTQKSEYFSVDLRPDEEFRPHREYALVFGFIVPVALDVTHPNDTEEGLDVRGPLGEGEVKIEVHLPSSRRLGEKDETKVIAVDESGEETPLQDYSINIDRAFKNTEISRPADVLRIGVVPPAGTASIRIRWPWSIRT